MPDFNPDKERHTGHKFIVLDATRNHMDGLQTAKGYLKFQQGRMSVKDEGLAREIQKMYPRDVTVTRVRRPHKADRGHKYFFGQMPEMPWKRKEENNANS